MGKSDIEPLRSYVTGSNEPALLELTIGDALARAADLWPTHHAIVDCGLDVRLTWSELYERAGRLGSGFLALGLTPGDRVGVWALNRYEWTLTQFAAAKAGLVLVTINPAYRVGELEFALKKVGCAAIVTAGAFKSSDYISMLSDLIPQLMSGSQAGLASPTLPELRFVIQMGEGIAPGAIAFNKLEELGHASDPARLQAAAEAIRTSDPANIQFTSGTTGAPKGVTLTHRNILNNGYFVGRALQLTCQDRVCIPVPLYHCFGMVMGNLAAVSHGAAMVYPGEGFDPGKTLRTVEAERCTALYGVPTMFIGELDHPEFDSFDISSLRTGIMAGSPCPIEVMRKVIERMHLQQITICYGMTETSPVSFQSSVDDTVERRVSTVGRVLPHLEVKIIDEFGDVVERGMPGELCTRGYSVMAGYWGEPEHTAAVLDSDGWMHSGDLATLDDDGYCSIVGRIKDMVIRGGENLYPREIEEFLYRHPAVRDVAVFGIPDTRFGEELCAWIIVNDGHSVSQSDIVSFCNGQISHQKIPRIIRFVDAFPMTVTGKVQKFIMRESMMQDTAIAQI